MSFDSDSKVVGREPVTVVEMEMDFCANTYSVSPCTADGATKCFNTFKTCQDPTNYVKTTKVYRFVSSDIAMPVATLDAIPCLERINRKPPELSPSEGLGTRASVSMTMTDFAHNDRLIDPYASERDYDPMKQGTFWGRFKARNPFYVGRPVRVYEGYRDPDGGFDLTDMRVRHYIIESIDGPGTGDQVRIKAKDPLKKLDGDRAQCPTASDGKLDSDITASDTTIPLASGYTTTYSDKHIKIGDEIIDVSGATFSGGTWTGVSRAAGGTEADEHDAGDLVQDCKTWEAVNVIDILREIMEDFADIDPAFIPYSGQWTEEKNASLTSFDLTTIIPEPTGCDKLVNELAEQVLLEIPFDEVDQKIYLRHETQWVEDVGAVNDEDHLIADSATVRDRHDLRLSRVWVYYGVRNFAEKLDPENFDKVVINLDAGAEDDNRFGDKRVKKVFSRWFPANNQTPANLLGQRLIQRFGDTPKEMRYELDARHEGLAGLGDVIRIKTRQDQRPDGTKQDRRWQVIQQEPIEVGHRYRFSALTYTGVPKTELTIENDVVDYVLYDELGQPPDPVNVTLTVAAGVQVSGNPALDLGALHPDSTVRIINKGTIWGNAGAGGQGGDAAANYETEPPGEWLVSVTDAQTGFQGKNALNLTVDTTLDNTNGKVYGGAGGGGGGGAIANESDGHIDSGGGGGGGYGPASVGGNAGTVTTGTFGNDTHQGLPGTNGTTSTNGSGGEGGTREDGFNFKDDGGDGGMIASKGATGQTPEPVPPVIGSNGAEGGEPGLAIKTNGNVITFEGGNNPTQIKGAVN